jgi:hypothetical protein
MIIHTIAISKSKNSQSGMSRCQSTISGMPAVKFSFYFPNGLQSFTADRTSCNVVNIIHFCNCRYDSGIFVIQYILSFDGIQVKHFSNVSSFFSFILFSLFHGTLSLSVLPLSNLVLTKINYSFLFRMTYSLSEKSSQHC